MTQIIFLAMTSCVEGEVKCILDQVVLVLCSGINVCVPSNENFCTQFLCAIILQTKFVCLLWNTKDVLMSAKGGHKHVMC